LSVLITSSIYAIILGMVEGITEFLPASSTGHLIVLTDLLQFRAIGGTFEIGIQLGAVMAVLCFYRFL
jgi:undecaprenyl-diphosphatase